MEIQERRGTQPSHRPDGGALAAIQGLNQKLEETQAENAELKNRLAKMEKALDSLLNK